MEPLRREMLPVLHRRHDHGEGLELEALLAEDGVGSKERDDLRQKIVVDGFRWTATWKLPSPSTYPAR